MSFDDFMAKIRYWDNRCARWMMRHFYIIFFEFVLVAIFFIFFFNTFRALDIFASVPSDDVIGNLLIQQNTHTLIIIVLLLLNSFWMLFMFNGLNRLRILLKDINFTLMRRKQGP